jgi:hypothetical protein
MTITTIGRGEIGGTLGRLWATAGHDVTHLGREGGDAADAEVVLLAPLGTVVVEALAGVSGLDGKVILDATNRLASQTPAPDGYDSIAKYVKRPPAAPVPRCSISTTGPSWTRRPAPRDDPATSGSATKAPATPSSSSARRSGWRPST